VRLFDVTLDYVAERAAKRRARREHGKIRMVVLALDEADAESRVDAWFQHQLEDSVRACITFGTGEHDALPGTIGRGAIHVSKGEMPHIIVTSLG
jgi:hypothetical protein